MIHRLSLNVAVVLVLASLPVRASDVAEFTKLYDELFTRPESGLDFNQVYENLERMTKFKSGNYSLDSKVASLVAIGNFSHNNCSITTFSRLQLWLEPDGLFGQSRVLPLYRDYCIEQQYLACRDELAQRLVESKSRWHPYAERNLNRLLRLFTQAEVDPMQPLGTQIGKFKNILAEYHWNDPGSVWVSSGSDRIKLQLYQITKDSLDIMEPFKQLLLIYNLILQKETTAKLIDTQSLEMIVILKHVEEILDLAGIILRMIRSNLHPANNAN